MALFLCITTAKQDTDDVENKKMSCLSELV